MRRFLALLLLLGLALGAPEAQLAQEALEAWLKGELSPTLKELLQAPPEEAPKLLKRYAQFPPPPPGLEVNRAQPRVEGNRVYFPAARGGEVGVVLEGGRAVRVFYRPEGVGPPAYLFTPAAGWGFLLLSLFWASLLRQPGPFRAAFLEALALLREKRGLYLVTNALLYSLFTLGALLAYALPEVARGVQALLGGTLEALGLDRAMEAGVMALAGVIFSWNLTQGLFLTGLLPALLLGLPVLLLNALRYFLFGFALSPALLGPLFLLHLPTLLLELQAYILVTFGGLSLLARLAGREGYRRGLRDLLLAFYLGVFFLLLAAWYEAFEVVFLL
ncbi:hypothetical protein [Thermus sp.]|uniref:hypothetical protein n=1 Tax=Thermus sp. TaxID=275 RepID=UPI00307CD62F